MGHGDRSIRRVVQVDWPGVEALAARVRESFPDATLLLFGSRARGTADEDSDYDFCVISRAFAGWKPWERMVSLAELWTLPAPVEIVAYTPEEWERLGPWTFVQTIRAEGRPVSPRAPSPPAA
ncbi:MAG: nucleotidyltransferase domain-containing protein [Candidatus Sericytochromatia bacterium]|nr:nucleotidyltransferase domain-containing protein [Candidatus Tanganyikabacteria bacterium]